MGEASLALVVAAAVAVLLLGYCAVGACVRYRGGIRRCPDMLPHSRRIADCWARCRGDRRRRRLGPADLEDTASVAGEDRAFSAVPSDPAALEEFDDEDDMIGDAAV